MFYLHLTDNNSNTLELVKKQTKNNANSQIFKIKK